MSGWSAVPDLGDDGRSRRTVPPPCRDPHRRSGWPPEFNRGPDPFWDDGRGARRRNMVQRTEASLALILAIAACGLTAAMWLRQVILPLFGVGI